MLVLVMNTMHEWQKSPHSIWISYIFNGWIERVARRCFSEMRELILHDQGLQVYCDRHCCCPGDRLSYPELVSQNVSAVDDEIHSFQNRPHSCPSCWSNSFCTVHITPSGAIPTRTQICLESDSISKSQQRQKMSMWEGWPIKLYWGDPTGRGDGSLNWKYSQKQINLGAINHTQTT